MSPEQAPRFRSLIPRREDDQPLSAEQALADWRPAGLALNMIASVDGQIAVHGRSGPLSSPPDRALFHALRARVDAVLVGAGTARAEGYGPIIRDEQTRARRAAAGRAEQPLAVIASRSLELDPALPLLADERSRVVFVTPSDGELRGAAAEVSYIRSGELAPALRELSDRYGAHAVLCEGGPSLNAALAREGLVAELFVTVAPLLVGAQADGQTLLGSPTALPRPLDLSLEALLAVDSQLYAHYVVGSSATAP